MFLSLCSHPLSSYDSSNSRPLFIFLSPSDRLSLEASKNAHYDHICISHEMPRDFPWYPMGVDGMPRNMSRHTMVSHGKYHGTPWDAMANLCYGTTMGYSCNMTSHTWHPIKLLPWYPMVSHGNVPIGYHGTCHGTPWNLLWYPMEHAMASHGTRHGIMTVFNFFKYAIELRFKAC